MKYKGSASAPTTIVRWGTEMEMRERRAARRTATGVILYWMLAVVIYTAVAAWLG